MKQRTQLSCAWFLDPQKLIQQMCVVLSRYVFMVVHYKAIDTHLYTPKPSPETNAFFGLIFLVSTQCGGRWWAHLFPVPSLFSLTQ